MRPASSERSPKEALGWVFMPATVLGVRGDRALATEARFCIWMAFRVQRA